MPKKVRVQIPETVAARVIFTSDRTCCVCRVSGKPVQIHHIDDHPSNNDEDNLCVLCLECHRETQIEGGFDRKLNTAIVRLYKQDWIETVAQRRSAQRLFTEARSRTHGPNELIANLNDPEEVESLIRTYTLISHRDTVTEAAALGSLATYILGRLPNSIELQAVEVAFEKMREDFNRGALHDSKALEKIHHNSVVDLRVLPRGSEGERVSSVKPESIAPEAWWGGANPKSVATLRSAIDDLGRPLRINCSSINVAAYAAINSMKRHNVALEILQDDASGREQVLSLRKDPSFDFVIAAEAPMFFDGDDNLTMFTKRVEINTERQVLFKRKGPAKGRVPTVWLYPNSSTMQQLLIAREDEDRFPVPREYEEESLELVDYVTLPSRMEQGDLVFAWDPLIRKFQSDTEHLILVKGTDFCLTISLFEHPRWTESDDGISDAFIDVLVGEWNTCRRNQLASWGRLLTDERFLRSLSRGSAFEEISC